MDMIHWPHKIFFYRGIYIDEALLSMFLGFFIFALICLFHKKKLFYIINSLAYEAARSLAIEKAHDENLTPYFFVLILLTIIYNFIGNLFFYPLYQLYYILSSLSIFIIFFTITYGLRVKKMKFFKIFVPEGIPLFLAPIIGILEFALFLIRPLTIAVRLIANVIIGHFLIDTLIDISKEVKPLGLLVLLINFFEVLLSLLQSYLFVMFIAIYIGKVHEEH